MGKLAGIRLFMLDMDGTFYLGDTLLPGALEFLAACRRRGLGYTFLTNNSSKSAGDYRTKLAAMGVRTAPEEMFTSGDATLLYLEQEAFPKEILLIGTESLKAQFSAAGYKVRARRPGAVVLGFDTGIDYPKLTALCDAVRAGLPYIATHPDYNCPVPGGMIPDIGAVIAFVQAATGRLPDTVVGKPSALIAQMAARRAGLRLEELCMVGDRLYTDIALGAAGVKTALVLTGETAAADLPGSPVQPDFVFADLAALAEELLAEPDCPVCPAEESP